MHRLGAAALGTALLLAAARPAEVHPHVFIDNHVIFVFDGAMMTGFREIWVFDDAFSDQLLKQFDADGDGHFSDEESDAVTKGTWPNLGRFH